MHRQSVGSPSPNNHQSHVVVKDIATTTLLSSTKASILNNYTDQKPQKRLHKAERFIHFIPILTLLCFLILYLSSHDPSQKDNSFDGMEKIIREVRKGEILAIRSLRNVEELEKEEMRLEDRQQHRKIGDF